MPVASSAYLRGGDSVGERQLLEMFVDSIRRAFGGSCARRDMALRTIKYKRHEFRYRPRHCSGTLLTFVYDVPYLDATDSTGAAEASFARIPDCYAAARSIGELGACRFRAVGVT